MKYRWLIPDGYWNSKSNGDFPSHESICVLNTGAAEAAIEMTLYFEDRDKMEGFTYTVPAERCAHIRMDKQKSASGQTVPQDTPYALVLESDTELSVQYTRVDSSQQALAMITTMIAR